MYFKFREDRSGFVFVNQLYIGHEFMRGFGFNNKVIIFLRFFVRYS